MPDFGLSKDSLRNLVSLAGEFVGTTDTLTLTNKTISVSSNSLTATSGALGDLLKHDGTSYVRQAKGTANQVHVTNSGGTDVVWGTVAVGGGGTGATTLTGILKGAGTSAITAVAAPTGSIVGDSDTQNISNKTIINPLFSVTQSSLNFLRSDAGDLTIDFGSDNAAGGTASLDFHNASGQDYVTRLTRGTGATGNFQFRQTGGGGFILLDTANINTTTSYTRQLYLPVTVDTVGTVPAAYRQLDLVQTYLGTQPTDPFAVVTSQIRSNLTYGSAIVAAKGTANLGEFSVDVQGSAHINCEINNLSLYNKASNSAQASHWLCDFLMYGPVAAQPGELSGITFLMNNYYNGSPSRRPSHFCCFQTNVGVTSPFKSADHTAGTAYKIDYGLMIQGYAGTFASQTRGIEVAILIGGNGGNWMASPTYSSKIGTGIQLKDIESVGIELLDPATSASTPKALTTSGATRAWDTFIDLSGGLAATTQDIKLHASGIFNANAGSLANVGSIVNASSGVTLTLSSALFSGVEAFRGSVANGLTLRANPNSTDATERTFTIQTLNAGTDTYSSSFAVTPAGANPFVYSMVPHKFDNYQDIKVITIPSDPASGYGRLYTKAVDANNDGLFVKVKINGAVTEVQVA